MAVEVTYYESINTTISLSWCGLYNLPSDHLECIINSTNNTNTANSSSQNESTSSSSSYCIYCPRAGYTFSTGEGLDDYYSRGHLTILGIHSVTGIIGILGAFATCLILAVLRRRRRASGSSFDLLLAALAWIDMTCCIAYSVLAVAVTSWYQNWNRGVLTLFSIYFFLNATVLAKSGSTLITIVITIERYVAIAFPFTAARLFTPFKTRLLVGLILAITFANGALRLSYSYVGRNRVDPRIASTRELEYLMYPSPITSLCLTCLLDILDQLVSIPILLLFNGLIFYNVRKISARRKELSSSQSKELNEVKMILPIVAVLLFCSIIPVISILFVLGKANTEMVMLGLACFAVNSAVNFPLYYWTSVAFRSEAKAVLATWLHCWRSRGSNNNMMDHGISQATIISRTSRASTTELQMRVQVGGPPS